MSAPPLVWMALLAPLGLAGGFALGKTAAPDASVAAAEERDAYTEAQESAKIASMDDARVKGARAGARQGLRQAKKQGSSNGAAIGSNAATAQLATAQRSEIESTPAPGTSGSAVCVAFQDYVPGVGCVPPVEPGETAAPINCPPGTVPVGVTGACGRP